MTSFVIGLRSSHRDGADIVAQPYSYGLAERSTSVSRLELSTEGACKCLHGSITPSINCLPYECPYTRCPGSPCTNRRNRDAARMHVQPEGHGTMCECSVASPGTPLNHQEEKPMNKDTPGPMELVYVWPALAGQSCSKCQNRHEDEAWNNENEGVGSPSWVIPRSVLDDERESIYPGATGACDASNLVPKWRNQGVPGVVSMILAKSKGNSLTRSRQRDCHRTQTSAPCW